MKRTVLLVLSACILLLACGSGAGASQDKTEASSNGSASFASSAAGTSGNTADVETDTDAPAADSSTQGNSSESGTTDNAEKSSADASPTLLYQGHASLRIVTADKKVIYIDPFAGEGYDLPADLILITHAHYDHTGTGLIKDRTPDCRIITQDEALQGGIYQTFDFDYATVEAVEAGYNANHDPAQCVGYLLTFANGETLYVTGDTSATPQMETLSGRNIDYAFFCCDGIYNMDAEEASACAEAVQAKHSIPYHTAAADKSLLDRENAERFHAPGALILEPGEELILH